MDRPLVDRTAPHDLAFDPEQGEVILEPEVAEPGYWVGCPGVLVEADRGRVLLTYRRRRPRGAGAERGWRVAIAESSDGVHFRDLWAVEKGELGTSSLERSCLLSGPGGGYLLYLSYVDPADNRWRIDVLEAPEVDGFDVAKAEPLLTAESTGTEGVKDPWAVRVGPSVFLYASYAAAADLDDGGRRRAHGTADVYTTGLTTAPTGLATSLDGRHFAWHGQVLPVGSGWDRYQSRLNSVLPLDGAYLGFYDGSSDETENYEERCGLALSFDLCSWRRLSVAEPWVTSPHGSGSVRYVDVAVIGEETWLYYECTRVDGAHELRRSRLGR